MSEVTQQISRVIIRATLQQVWDAITKEGVVLPHFFGSVMHTTGLKPGSQLRMRTPNGKYTAVVGEILEWDPPHRFSHTFRFTDLNDPPCRVSYELKEVDGGVEFTLISDQIVAGSKTEKQMAQGGPFITSVLKCVVEDGRPSFKQRLMLGMITVLGPLITPAVCRSENWPLDKRV